MATTTLDFGNIIRAVYDPPTESLKVKASLSVGESEVIISHTDDSIRLGDGTNLVTVTQVGSDYGLDVNVIGGAVTGTFTPSGLTVGGRTTEVTLNSSSWTALPSSPLANRNAITIQNRSGIEIKVNFNSSVSGYTGLAMPNGFERFYDITDDIIIYAKAQSGTPTIVVEELA